MNDTDRLTGSMNRDFCCVYPMPRHPDQDQEQQECEQTSSKHIHHLSMQNVVETAFE